VNAADKLQNIRVVLCGTVHPGNIGACARALKTMGLTDLRLVHPVRFPHPQAEWLASGAADVLARARRHDSLDEALEGAAFTVACTARVRELAAPMVTARVAAARLIEVGATQPVALVFGNETSGLTGAEVGLCNLLATIPADPTYSSLNLGAAVQVVCYEVRQAALAGDMPRYATPELAAHRQIEDFYTDLEKTLVATGFLDPAHPKKLMPRLRRLFSRARLETEEVSILRGVLRSFRTPKIR
jgi:tRNA/rRNA methyltransferase